MNISIYHNRRKTGRSAVEIGIYISRDQRKIISTGVIVTPSQWNDRTKKVTKHPRETALNHTIHNLIAKIMDWERNTIMSGRELCIKDLMVHIRRKGSDTSFNDFMLREIEKDRQRLSPATYKSHLSIHKRLCEFATINLHSFTTTTINNYHSFLLGYMKESTTPKSHKTVRKYVNRAIDSGLLTINPYKSFRIPRERQRRVHLSTDELDLIRSYQGNQRLEKVRDLFLFQCLTGMAYVDMQNLKHSDIHTHNKLQYIIKNRQKSDRVPQMIPLLDESLQIINRYSGSEMCFPRISNQRMNAYLSEIAAIAGINKPLTTHVARHTFAVLMLERGLPLETISHVLGHSSTRQTSVYARMMVSKIENDLKRLDIKGL